MALAAAILGVGCQAPYAAWEHAPDGSIALSDLACLSGTPPADAAGRQTYVNALSELSVRYVRWEATWSSVEKVKGVYDFSGADQVEAMFADAGVQQFYILDYGNTLYSVAGAANNDDKYPPDDPADFARFAAAAAGRYGSTIKRYEVWNEENDSLRFWKPTGNPTGYAALLEATYPAVKGACSDCEVIFGSTISDGYPNEGIEAGADFVRDARDAGASRYDAVAVHPYMLYPPCSPPEDSTNNVCQFWPGTRELSFEQQVANLAATAGNVPVYATEYGWPTFTPATSVGQVTEDAQAEWLVRGALLLASMGVESVCWFTLFDGQDENNGYVPEGSFGLLWYSGAKKRAYQAYVDLFGTLHPGAFVRDRATELGLQQGEHALLFDDSGQRLTTFLWREESANARTVDVPLFGPTAALQPGWGPLAKLTLKNRGTASVTLDVVPIALTSHRP